MIKAYRKTGTIKAEQFDGSLDLFIKYDMIDIGTMCEERHSPEVYMSGDHRKLTIGDWIITDNFNHHTSMTDKEFQQQYAELPVIPNYVAEYIDTEKNNTDVIQAGIDAIEYSKGSIELTTWIEENGDAFARAWLDGFQMEEDK